MTNILEFYDMLKNHDWFYSYSDDYRVWRNGEDMSKKLTRIANESDQHRDLYRMYVDFAVRRNREKEPTVEEVDHVTLE